MVYEAGIKSDYSIGGLPVRTNAAAFYYDYDNKVLQGLVSVCDLAISDPTQEQDCNTNFIQNQNAGKVSLMGFEVEGDILLPLDMRLRANFAYLDSEIKDGKILDTRQNGQVEVDVTGNMLPDTSKYNFNLALSQSIYFGRAVSSFDWTISGAYRSKYYLSIYNNEGFDESGNPIALENMAVNSSGFITGQGFPEANGNFLSDEVPATFY